MTYLDSRSQLPLPLLPWDILFNIHIQVFMTKFTVASEGRDKGPIHTGIRKLNSDYNLNFS